MTFSFHLSIPMIQTHPYSIQEDIFQTPLFFSFYHNIDKAYFVTISKNCFFVMNNKEKSIIPNSYDRVFNISKREDIKSRGVSSSIQVLMGTVYYIITKEFSYQKGEHKKHCLVPFLKKNYRNIENIKFKKISL